MRWRRRFLRRQRKARQSFAQGIASRIYKGAYSPSLVGQAAQEALASRGLSVDEAYSLRMYVSRRYGLSV